jgi:uncharacterized protein YjlB
MRGLARTHLRARQRGAALLILLAILSMAIIYAVVAGLNKSARDLAQARDEKTYAALAQAKAALIAYAVTYKDTHDNPAGNSYTVPGYLPCPDLGSSASEGQAASNCGASLVSVMGKLPWKTLGLDALKDGSGECLWYAVSGTYMNNPNGVSGSTTNSNMMNWDTNGQFNIMDTNGTSFLTGSTPDTDAVAVIFAPGSTLSGQNRAPVAGTTNCGGNYTAAAYLETANGINNSVVSGTAGAQSTFIAGTAGDTFNDKLVYITRADLWNAIKKRSDFNNYLRAMTRLATECVAQYGNQNSNNNDQRLPWASNASLSGTSVPTYAVNARYNDASNALYGRLSFRVDTSRNQTNNNISSSISDYGTNGAYIFTNSSYCSYTPDQKIWYDNWKDQLFYAVATNFRPAASWSQSGNCSSSTCLQIGGSNFAAVVIFAGDKLTNAAGQVTQPRNTAADKGTIGNYLEGSNTVANTGNSTYQATAASNSFNDIVYAIDSNLNVYCSIPTTGSMVRPTTTNTVAPPGTGTAGAYYTDLKNYAACP